MQLFSNQATSHGVVLFGLPASIRVVAEWAAWVNRTVVRELDFHDTFLAADDSRSDDNTWSILAFSQQSGRNGNDVIRGIIAAYEAQVNLVKSIYLCEHNA